MIWRRIDEIKPPPGRYVVKTQSPSPQDPSKMVHRNVIESEVSYDNKGKAHWTCRNQTPYEWLDQEARA